MAVWSGEWLPQDLINRESRLYRGFLVGIKAPISLNPEVVSRVVTTGLLRTDKDADYDIAFNEGVLLGSTEERTTLYAGFTELIPGGTTLEIARGNLVSCMVGLMKVLGDEIVETEMVMPPETLMMQPSVLYGREL